MALGTGAGYPAVAVTLISETWVFTECAVSPVAYSLGTLRAGTVVWPREDLPVAVAALVFFVALLQTRSLVISGMKIAVICYRAGHWGMWWCGPIPMPSFSSVLHRYPMTTESQQFVQCPFSCLLFSSVAALLNWTLEPFCDYFHL